MHHSIRAISLTIAVSLAGGLLAPTAHADTSADAETIEASAAANAAAGEPHIPQAITAGGTLADTAGGPVAVSTDPGEGFTATDLTGTDISLKVPDGPTAGTVVAGNVVYPDVAPDASVVVRPANRGAQALVVIVGGDAPEHYAFPVEVNRARTGFRQDSDGSIDILGPDGSNPVATVAPPWAADATGAAVPTHYEIEGSSIVQVVEHHGAAYPVTADPKVSLGWKIYVKYSKSEVHKVASNPLTNKFKYTAAICVAIPNAVAAASCGFYVYDSYSSVSSTFESADRHKRCVEMQYLYSGLLVGWKSYSC